MERIPQAHGRRASATSLYFHRAFNRVAADHDTRCVTILDVDRDRVLLTQQCPPSVVPSERALPPVMARIAAMSWEEDYAFMREHRCGRYVL